MKLSVIVPTCDRPKELGLCLTALAAEIQQLDPEFCECIVTDDGLLAEARRLIETQFTWARCVRGPQSGPAANRNNGARVAKGEWFAFTDDDCIPREDWIRQIVEAIGREPKVRVVEGRTIADRARRSLAESSPINESGGNLWSCNIAVHRDIFWALGGFDERFPYPAMEDVDFAQRIRECDVVHKFAPEAVVVHPWRQRRPVREAQRYHKSVNIYIKKYPGKAKDFSAWAIIICQGRYMIKHTFPNAIRLRGRGITSACLDHIMEIWHAFSVIGKR